MNHEMASDMLDEIEQNYYDSPYFDSVEEKCNGDVPFDDIKFSWSISDSYSSYVRFMTDNIYNFVHFLINLYSMPFNKISNIDVSCHESATKLRNKIILEMLPKIINHVQKIKISWLAVTLILKTWDKCTLSLTIFGNQSLFCPYIFDNVRNIEIIVRDKLYNEVMKCLNDSQNTLIYNIALHERLDEQKCLSGLNQFYNSISVLQLNKHFSIDISKISLPNLHALSILSESNENDIIIVNLLIKNPNIVKLTYNRKGVMVNELKEYLTNDTNILDLKIVESNSSDIFSRLLANNTTLSKLQYQSMNYEAYIDGVYKIQKITNNYNHVETGIGFDEKIIDCVIQSNCNVISFGKFHGDENIVKNTFKNNPNHMGFASLILGHLNFNHDKTLSDYVNQILNKNKTLVLLCS